MIKFFRKIRQNLLLERKTGEYLKYAMGEIVLVVIGILIALTINNWNDSRINFGKQRDYLFGLKNDLENQLAAFHVSNEYYDNIIITGESILVEFSSTGQLSTVDSINTKLSNLMYTNKYPEISTTFSELNSTGQIGLIKNKSLRTQVIRYYQNNESSQELVDGNTENVIYNQLFPIIKSTVIIHPENFGFENREINLMDKLKTEFERNLNNPSKVFELANTISLRILVAKTNKGYVENAQNEAELLLIEIKKELGMTDSLEVEF